MDAGIPNTSTVFCSPWCGAASGASSMPSESARIWWLRHTARSGRPDGPAVRDDLAHPPHPGAAGIARVAGSGPAHHEVRLVELRIGDGAPGRDLDLEAEVAQLMREHRGEPVLGVDHDRGPAGERTGARGILRVQPERREPGVARGEERGDGGIVGEQPGSRRGGVLVDRGVVDRGLRDAVARHRADRAEHTRRPCRASR